MSLCLLYKLRDFGIWLNSLKLIYQSMNAQLLIQENLISFALFSWIKMASLP